MVNCCATTPNVIEINLSDVAKHTRIVYHSRNVCRSIFSLTKIQSVLARIIIAPLKLPQNNSLII